jgi:hypothetical protein
MKERNGKRFNSENLKKHWYTASFVAFHVMCVYISTSNPQEKTAGGKE